MKQTLLLLALLLPMLLQAQIQLKNGYYKSQDGYITITIEHEGDIIRMKEPTRTNEYKRTGGNTYQHTEDKYSNYGLIVTDAEHMDATKDGRSNHTWTWSGKAPTAEDFVKDADDEEDGCPVAEKYMTLAENDKTDTQVYTFCGAAALMKCNMNSDGYAEYARQAITSLKQIMVNPNVNPCTDVFTAAQWSAN
jgi:hypothetical protein